MSSIFITHYGEEHQLKKLVEECQELIEAINLHLDGKDTIEHVKEEMGDVDNLIDQFKEHYPDCTIQETIVLKRLRQIKRIELEK